MVAIHAGHDVRIERVAETIILTITEDNIRYVVSERGVHIMHADCHRVLDEPPSCEIVELPKDH